MEPPSFTPTEYAAIRYALGLSLAGMAAAVGVRASTIMRREQGDDPIGGEAAHAILRVAELMELDVYVLLGRSADESRGRAVHVAQRGVEYWNRREKADILLPLARWTTLDVFRYAALREVPLHPAYHHMTELGFDRLRVRHSTAADVIARRYGQVEALRRLYPDTYRRYVEIAPQVQYLT